MIVGVLNEPIKDVIGYNDEWIDKLSHKSLAIPKIVCNFAKRNNKDMDPVLVALKHYRVCASEKQKSADLNRLENECLSTVDAYDYVYAITIQNKRHSNQQELVNYNMNPDYNLDFSLYIISNGYSRCICV